MKFVLNLLLTFGIGFFLNQMVHAEPIFSSEIRILGRGITNPEKSEEIALACVDTPRCRVVQFMAFRKEGPAEGISQMVVVPVGPTEALTIEALKLQLKYRLTLIGSDDLFAINDLTNRDGFNWSGHPNELSSRRYARVRSDLQAKVTRYQFTGQGAIGRIYQKILHLQDDEHVNFMVFANPEYYRMSDEEQAVVRYNQLPKSMQREINSAQLNP